MLDIPYLNPISPLSVGEVVIYCQVDQIADVRILAVRGHVGDLGPVSQFVDAGDGCGAQIFGAGAGNLAGDLSAGIRGLLSGLLRRRLRMSHTREHCEDTEERKNSGWHATESSRRAVIRPMW